MLPRLLGLRLPSFLKYGLRIGIPSLFLMLAGCESGKRYITLPIERAKTWEMAARELCPQELDLADRLREMNFNAETPLLADTRWYSKLREGIRIEVPEPLCRFEPPKVEPADAGTRPIEDVAVTPEAGKPDVVETAPEVTPEVSPEVGPEVIMPEVGPEATPEAEAQPDVVKPPKDHGGGGHRPRPDAHTGGQPDQGTVPNIVIPQ